MGLKSFDWWLKWGSTTFLIFASVLTSANIYPVNLIFSFLGNFGWMWAGWRMREPSLWVVSLFLLAVYLGGLLYSSVP
jgi:hypothetical protein